MILSESLVYILPPVIGAGIGLFTNWLAIKMLFRPLAERRVLGFRVPFTPGILPRERPRLSRSIGDAVAVDLLDEATIAGRLRSPAFRESLRQAALGLGRKALQTRPSDMASGLDRRMVDLLHEAALEALSGLATSETVSDSLIAGSAAAIDASRDVPLSSLLDHAAATRIVGSLASPEGSERAASAMAGAIVSALERAAAEGKSVSSFIDEDALTSFSSRAIDAAYPVLTEAIDGILSEKAVVASMEKAGARIIRRSLDRFNSVQRFFIGLGQYDRAILDNMPATIADFSETVRSLLSEASTRKAIADRVTASISAFAERPLSSFAFMADEASVSAARESLAATLRSAFGAIDAEAAGSIVSGSLERGTIGGALERFPGLEDRIGPAVARWAAGMFGRESASGSAAGRVAAAFFSAFSIRFGKEAASVPLGKTVALDDEALESLAVSASEGLAELAASESSSMLRSMDIRSLVVEKIDTLDMIDVERMILKVVDKELGAITIFGGILGAIIGIFQSLFFLLR